MNKQADQKTLVKFFGPIKVEKVQASRGKTLGNLTYFIATYPDGYKDFDTELEAVEWAKKKAPSIQRFLDGYVARGASTMKKQTAMIHRELIGVFGPIKVEKVSGASDGSVHYDATHMMGGAYFEEEFEAVNWAKRNAREIQNAEDHIRVERARAMDLMHDRELQKANARKFRRASAALEASYGKLIF